MDITIFPVPAMDLLYIRGLTKKCLIEILDLSGKILRIDEAEGGEVAISIGELKNGFYFLRIDNQTFEFIKE